jgi:hypothetical protein
MKMILSHDTTLKRTLRWKNSITQRHTDHHSLNKQHRQARVMQHSQCQFIVPAAGHIHHPAAVPAPRDTEQDRVVGMRIGTENDNTTVTAASGKSNALPAKLPNISAKRMCDG